MTKTIHTAKEALLATILVAAFAIPLSFMSLRAEFLGPIKQDVDDFDIYDLFYSGREHTHPGTRDTNIVIVQTADERTAIADQVNKIKSLHPAVIGIDVSFEDRKAEPGDSLLEAAIMNDSLVVPGYTLAPGAPDQTVVAERFLPKEYLQRKGGYMNFPYRDSDAVIRYFSSYFPKDRPKFFSFPVRVAEMFSASKTKKFRDRANDIETISYSGNTEYYLTYSSEEFERKFYARELEDFRDKIVLLGYFAQKTDRMARIEDMFFSPLNDRPKGKSFPDIYGVIIHANIVSMIISGRNYVTILPVWLSFLIGFCLSFLMNLLIVYFYKRYRHPYHIVFFVIQLVATVTIVFLFIKIFGWFSIKAPLSPVVLALVLPAEIFDLYKILAKFLYRKFHYKTIFSSH